MIHHVLQHLLIKMDWKKFIRFIFVGGISFLIYFFAYLLLSRVVLRQVNATVLNVIAICVSMLFNFLAHRRWTYEVQEKHIGQVVRYFFVVLFASAIQIGVFYIGFEILHVHDLFITVIAAGVRDRKSVV